MIKALPKREMKKRSPLVVFIGRKPFAFLVGNLTSKKVRQKRDKKIRPKKTAVGVVQAIQSILNPFMLLNPPQR